MELTDELIDKLATLSRLNFNSEEKLAIKADLEKMLAFVNKLQEVDTTGVEPLTHISGNVNMLRADEVTESITREAALRNAPLHDNIFFKVPKMIRK